MSKVYLHCPLNISRTLVQMILEYSKKIKEETGSEIEILDQPHRPDEKSLFETDFGENEFPDMIIGHVNDFATLSKAYLEKYFMALPEERYPLRKELVNWGFKDSRGYFHPFTVIPFSIFYNKNLLDDKELPKVWLDLLDKRWSKKIRMPDDFRMVSIIIRTFMKGTYPNEFEIFDNNVVHSGSPIDVVHAVDNGDFLIGITNIAFANISRNKNTSIIWPKDGLLCMPQVMVFSKNADESLLKLGDFLMSEKVQSYLALQGFVPCASVVDIPEILTANNFSLHWNNWDYYLKMIRENK